MMLECNGFSHCFWQRLNPLHSIFNINLTTTESPKEPYFWAVWSKSRRDTLVRIFYLVLGFFFVGVGILGILLPLLPTTVFFLLAAGCFARSSDRWYQWLLSNPVFGPIINNWHEKKCITAKTKIVAISSIFLFGGYSIFFAITNPYIKIVGILLLATGLFTVLRLAVCENDSVWYTLNLWWLRWCWNVILKRYDEKS